MSKKSFKDNPALAFINPQVNAQDNAQDDTQEVTQYIAQDDAYVNTQHDEHENTHEYTHENTQQDERREYVRTQGRKGHRKPRINLAFDSGAFLEKIRKRAEREGKSITQFINDAAAFYLEHKKMEGRK
jgi:hypothetical protein